MVPPRHAQYSSKIIPQAELKFFPDEGHFSLPANHQFTILKALITT